MDNNCIVPKSIYTKDGTYYLIINAKPNSKISQITDLNDEAVDVNIAAQPRDGEANQELCEFIAQCLGIKKTHISVSKGGKGRNKLLVVDAKQHIKNVDELYQRLKQSMQ